MLKNAIGLCTELFREVYHAVRRFATKVTRDMCQNAIYAFQRLAHCLEVGSLNVEHNLFCLMFCSQVVDFKFHRIKLKKQNYLLQNFFLSDDLDLRKKVD